MPPYNTVVVEHIKTHTHNSTMERGGPLVDQQTQSKDPRFESTRCHIKNWDIMFSAGWLCRHRVNIFEQNVFGQN